MSSSSVLSALLITFNAYVFGIINVNGDCPDTIFSCPHGDTKAVGSCAKLEFKPFPTITCYPCSENVIERESSCYGTKCGDYRANSRADGCSAEPEIFEGPMDWLFKDSCDMHDICYSTYGIPKADCDTQFYVNMKRQCGSNYNPTNMASCLAIASGAYGAVVQWGDYGYEQGQAAAKAAADKAPCVGRRLLMTETVNEAESIPNGLETRFHLSFDDKFEDSLRNDQDLLNEFKSAVGKVLSETMSAIPGNTMNNVGLGRMVGFGYIDNVNQADGDKFNSILKDDTLNKYAYLNIKFDLHSTELSMLKSYLLADGITKNVNEAIESELKSIGKDVFGGLNLRVHLVDANLY